METPLITIPAELADIRNVTPVRRFIAVIHEMPYDGSVKRHHRWQASLDEKDFVKRIMTVQRG